MKKTEKTAAKPPVSKPPAPETRSELLLEAWDVLLSAAAQVDSESEATAESSIELRRAARAFVDAERAL